MISASTTALRVILGMALLSHLPSLLFADSVPPFVAGFDRFARHQDLSELQAGRLLITELSCTACHQSKDKTLEPKLGPRLTSAGSQFNAPWLAAYLQSPNEMKPGTTMPDVLASLSPQDKRDAAAAIAAYLSSLQKPFPKVAGNGATPVPFQFWTQGDAQTGKLRYHQIGCIACHEPDPQYEVASVAPTAMDRLIEDLEPEELADLGFDAAARKVSSVPLGLLADKYSVKALTHFLLDPLRTRPAGRMPHFNLPPHEAADIAAYLVEDFPQESAVTDNSKPTPTNADLIAQGEQLFQKFQCNACHQKNSISTSADGRPLEACDMESKHGCLSEHSPRQVRYDLDPQQRSTLKATLNQLRSSDLSSPNAQGRLRHSMAAMNCYACHQRDQLGGVGRYRKPYFETLGAVDLGDEGRLPPPLTGVGKKLKPDWMKKLISGKGSRIRPHMHVRMPRFSGEMATSFAEQVAEVDKPDRRSATQVFGDALEHAVEGRTMMDVGCVQCHQFRGDSLPGVVGVDLQHIGQQLYPAWFREFVLNPADLKPRTRMPTFFPGGVSQRPDLLGGEVNAQIGAMWSYLTRLDSEPLPEKIQEARAANYLLTPQEKPVLLRTFMQEAGTHAIAVGFPEGVHFALDAETSQPAVAWRGAFLDAQGTWFIRFAPPADPLGNDVAMLPRSRLIQLPDERSKAKSIEKTLDFAGYRIGKDGIPVFLYRVDGVQILDRITPTHAGLHRSLEFQWKSGHPGSFRWITDSTDVRVRLWNRNEKEDVLIQLSAEQPSQRIEMEYQW